MNGRNEATTGAVPRTCTLKVARASALCAAATRELLANRGFRHDARSTTAYVLGVEEAVLTTMRAVAALDSSLRAMLPPDFALSFLKLASAPRSLRYADATRFDLAAAGVDISRGDYQVVELPRWVGVRDVTIPSRRDDLITGLRFLASVVPHVGVDDDRGYFLASYERVVSSPPIRLQPLFGMGKEFIGDGAPARP